MLVVEAGIPVATRVDTGQIRRTFQSMKPGDSVLIGNGMFASPVTVRSLANKAGHDVRGKFASRTVAEGIRVWRLE